MNSSPTSSIEPLGTTVKPARPPTSRRRLWIALSSASLAVAATAIVLAVSQHSASGKEAERPLADVPWVEGDRIVFSEAFARRIGLATELAVAAELKPVVAAVGAVDFDPSLVAVVGTRLRGLVSRVVKFEGDTVEKGALLAVIESPELGEAQASLSFLLAEKVAAQQNSRRESELFEKNLSTAREAEVALAEFRKYQALHSAAVQKVSALAGSPGGARATRLGQHELRAPIAGTVVEHRIAPGQVVEGQLVAFKVANLERLWAELSVVDHNLPSVYVGDKVELETQASPGGLLEGRVARIGAELDAETRSARVRVEIDNTDGRLRAGQSVSAKIHASGREQGKATLVPSRAVTYVDGKPTLFVAESPTRVRVAPVELGAGNGQQVAVKSGIAPAERVVTEGAFELKSELFR